MRYLTAKLLGATYFFIGAWLLALGLLVMAPTLYESPSWSAGGTTAAFVCIGAVPLAGGIGLWKQRAWSKWLFLLAASFACLPAIMSLPFGMDLYQRYIQPLPGDYVVLSREEFIKLLAEFVFRPLVVAVLALVAAAVTFFHFRSMPNHSFKRTPDGAA